MALERKMAKKDKDILLVFDGQVKDIRQQLNEQLKCLDVRLETQVALVTELQDFFRRRAEVEMEYSKSLDKLSKTLLLRHKAEKQKRDQWHLFSSYTCWQHLVSTTRRQSKDHAVLSEIYANQLVNRFNHITEDVQRIYRRCREIGMESHEELLKVLHELHTTMKTYHTYHNEEKQAESKLQYVEAQRAKLEQSIPHEKLEKSKKFRLIEKEAQKRQSKYNDAKLKAVKARNDYLLCMDASNAAIHKYFVDDLSDLIDCMDFGFHTCLARTLMMYVSSEECLKRSKQASIDGTNKCIAGLDSRVDKQKFLEFNNSAFMVPKKFEFQPHRGDEMTQVFVDKAIRDEMEQRYKHLSLRLTALKTESEEIWKTLETAERSLLDMISAKDYDCTSLFEDDGNRNGMRQPEALFLKLRADRQETEDFYLNKFREYTLGSNLIARLQAKADLMRRALGGDGETTSAGGSSPSLMLRPHSLPHKVRKKRIGRTPLVGQPKLFGGSLEEYVEATNQEIPLIIRSCIRIINLYGLHHQGIFRVSGSQVEINNFREAFERGEDPLADMTDASDINSVGGVLKLYLRELREPLFPIFYFDQLVEISQLESKAEFIGKVKDVVTNLPRPVVIVLRYLFAFLNHLSEFSDENMMDPYNLAICFGPTLLPIPEDKDQVQYQNLVNELIKNIIIYQEEIFPDDGGTVYEKYISTNVPDENDVGESPPEHGLDQMGDSEMDAIPSEDDTVFPDREITLKLFGKAEVLEAVAQFDFIARSERELSFKRGETLLLYSQVSNDWWKGSFNGVEGLIPDKYILLKIRDEDKDKISTDGSEKRRTSSSSDSLSGAVPSPKLSSRISEEIGGRSNSTESTVEAVAEQSSLLEEPPASTTPASSLMSSPQFPCRGRSPSPSSVCSLPPQSPVEWVRDSLLPTSTADGEDSASVTSLSVKDLSSYDLADEESNLELAKDLDTTLAKVFSSIDSLEKGRQKTLPDKKCRLPCKDTPDLVMDLPVNPSSPTSGTKERKNSESTQEGRRSLSRSSSDSSDSPELTTAERFAMSNQCTMKKGSMTRSASQVSSNPPSSDAQTQTFHTVKRSASTSVDLAPAIPMTPPLGRERKSVLSKLETRSCEESSQNELTASSTISEMRIQEIKSDTVHVSTGGVSTFKPQMKVKPPIMKKPTNYSPPQPARRSQEREYRQTSC